jgi:hypothetical protein
MQVVYKGGYSSELNSNVWQLTYNKIYNIEPIRFGSTSKVYGYSESTEVRLKIKCDNGNIQWIPKEHFITLDDHRDKLIEDITNESNI